MNTMDSRYPIFGIVLDLCRDKMNNRSDTWRTAAKIMIELEQPVLVFPENSNNLFLSLLELPPRFKVFSVALIFLKRI
jgi:hypothetical protein